MLNESLDPDGTGRTSYRGRRGPRRRRHAAAGAKGRGRNGGGRRPGRPWPAWLAAAAQGRPSSSSSPAVSAGPASHAKRDAGDRVVRRPTAAPDASYGPEGASGAYRRHGRASTRTGEVLGRKFVWPNVDDRGDPADAVPAADKLIASSPNLVGIIGRTPTRLPRRSDLRPGAHPDDRGSGPVAVRQESYRYFWRNTPPDAASATRWPTTRRG